MVVLFTHFTSPSLFVLLLCKRSAKRDEDLAGSDQFADMVASENGRTKDGTPHRGPRAGIVERLWRELRFYKQYLLKDSQTNF